MTVRKTESEEPSSPRDYTPDNGYAQQFQPSQHERGYQQYPPQHAPPNQQWQPHSSEQYQQQQPQWPVPGNASYYQPPGPVDFGYQGRQGQSTWYPAQPQAPYAQYPPSQHQTQYYQPTYLAPQNDNDPPLSHSRQGGTPQAPGPSSAYHVDQAADDRGFTGGVLGGVAGAYAGHQVHHGVMGAVGGAVAGSMAQDQLFPKKEKKEGKKSKKRMFGFGHHRRDSSSSSSSSDSSSSSGSGKHHHNHQHGPQQHHSNQQQHPAPGTSRGNFSASSTMISLDKDFDLIASCAAVDGSRKLTSVDLNDCLTNENGRFRWCRGGNFAASARDVRLEDGGRALRAELCAVDGRWVADVVRLDERITNEDGELKFLD